MNGKLSSRRPTVYGSAYPHNLALEVRNFIVLVMGRIPPDDRETFQKFLAVVFELERVFEMFD
ncbi:MAG: hypothetical protein U0136_07790 [Bdellovibrionota bacterium]